MSLSDARELAVLSVLHAHPAHGYAISKAFDSGPLALLGLSRHAIYRIIDRFQRRGWVTGEVDSSNAFPDREILTLTPDGQRAFQDMLTEVSDGIPHSVSPILAVTMVLDAGQTLPRDTLQTLLQSRIDTLTRMQDDAHAETLSMRVSQDILRAEIDVLQAALAAVP